MKVCLNYMLKLPDPEHRGIMKYFPPDPKGTEVPARMGNILIRQGMATSMDDSPKITNVRKKDSKAKKIKSRAINPKLKRK